MCIYVAFFSVPAIVAVDIPKYLILDVQGKGIMADLYRALVTKLSPVPHKIVEEFRKCLPQPRKPNLHAYYLIRTSIGTRFSLNFTSFGIQTLCIHAYM